MSEKKDQAPELKEQGRPRELTDQEMEQAARDTGAALAAEPKVRIKIPKDPLNKGDGVVPVCVNGYHYQIKRGEAVEVPQTVADILERAKYI